jgi:prepilin-type N-terminal cleavage/methylation domain-containing protein
MQGSVRQCPQQRGVTIIEVMIALAIFSLLVAMSIPSFTNHLYRSRQAEVKTNLVSLARGEYVHYAEHDTYTDNLSAVGWSPDGSPRYLYGFTSDNVPSASGINDTAELASAHGTSAMVTNFGVPLTEADLPTATVATDSFTAAAVGNIDNDATLDRWTLSDANILTNVTKDGEE